MTFLRYCCRVASPSTLLLAVLLFFLPWVEIQCAGQATTLQQRLIGERHTIRTQSGLQAIRGEWSEADPNDRTTLTAAGRRYIERLRRHMPAAPLLVLYLGLLAAGIGCTLVCRAPRLRLPLVGGCVLAALATLAVQRSQGLPLAQAFQAAAREGIIEEGNAEVPAEVEADLQRSIRYTGWFWLGPYILALSLLLLPVEWWCCRQSRTEQPLPTTEPSVTGSVLPSWTQTNANTAN
jgi:hypothetical protein